MKPLPRAVVWIVLPALWLAVLLSATAAIYCKHRARELFAQLEEYNRGRDNLEAEWGRLQIEQSFWSTYGYVENVASTRLHMRIPASNDIKLPTP